MQPFVPVSGEAAAAELVLFCSLLSPTSVCSPGQHACNFICSLVWRCGLYLLVAHRAQLKIKILSGFPSSFKIQGSLVESDQPSCNYLFSNRLCQISLFHCYFSANLPRRKFQFFFDYVHKYSFISQYKGISEKFLWNQVFHRLKYLVLITFSQWACDILATSYCSFLEKKWYIVDRIPSGRTI